MLPLCDGVQSIGSWQSPGSAGCPGTDAKGVKSMKTRIGPIRCRYGLALVAVTLSSAAIAVGQLRDSFERPEVTWQISKEADCGVRILAHDRPYRDAHSGQASERFRLAVGQGTFLPLVHPVGRAPVIQEFRPRLFVKADR